jgi:hypothetical protein
VVLSTFRVSAGIRQPPFLLSCTLTG